MTEIIYDVNGLTINVHFDKQTQCVEWTILSGPKLVSILRATQIKTLIETLQKSLDFEWEPQT